MFITFEGPEGGGKSTLVAKVAERLTSLGHQVLSTREPGSGQLGQKIRDLLLHGEDLPPATELFLFLADRSHHVAKVIRPALAQGQIVLCDRYADSTWVYQAYSRGLDRKFVLEANRFATQGLQPDLTLLLDLPPEIGVSRLQNPDRMDAEPIEFHRLVREGFLELANSDPGRWRIVDASQSPSAVAQCAFEIVSRELRT